MALFLPFLCFSLAFDWGDVSTQVSNVTLKSRQNKLHMKKQICIAENTASCDSFFFLTSNGLVFAFASLSLCVCSVRTVD